MRKIGAIVAAVAAFFLLTAQSCGYRPPCETLPAPTANEQGAARDGSEVEREIGGAECVVSGNRWVQQTD